MRETLTSNPELFSDISWNLLLLGEETAKKWDHSEFNIEHIIHTCLLYTSPSPRDRTRSRMPSSA